MRRSGAPSLRRNGNPGKSNEEILAMLTSPASSNRPSFSSPLATSHKNTESSQSPCSTISTRDDVSSMMSSYNDLTPPLPSKDKVSPSFNTIPHSKSEGSGSSTNSRPPPHFPRLMNRGSACAAARSSVDVETQQPRVVQQNVEGHGENDSVYSYYTCVWCKKSGRKHKKWEGDGLVKVGERSVVLLDEQGKELARGSGYKIQDLQHLQDGSLLSVGSKEIEITGNMDRQAWDSKVHLGKENVKNESCVKSAAAQKGKKRKTEEEDRDEPAESPASKVLASLKKRANMKPFQMPRQSGGGSNERLESSARQVKPGVSMFDPNREGALVLHRPPPGHQLNTEKLVDVVVDPYIASKLRPHQRSGVLFMYKSLMGYTTINTDEGEFKVKGCILADDMGLGKTLQTISVVWTMLKQSPVAGCTLARKILIISPASLLNNWEAEFKKWLGTTRIVIHVADNAKKVASFKAYRTAPVLIISYEMLVRAENELREVRWDLVVCDEAHRLKNSEIKTSTALSRLNCERKILLTGTPVQNDLQEYYCLVNVVIPGLLGSKASFTTEFVQRIEKGRDPGAQQDLSQEAELALRKLSEISRKILLRRTSDIISGYLPPKTTCVVFCRPSDFQAEVYSREVERLYHQLESEPGSHLTAISTLKKICNSPLLVDNLDVRGGPSTWEEQSGKLSVLTCLMLTLMQTTDEKIVLVSLSTSTLDLLENLCSRYSLATLRLDGKTPPAARQTLVNRFNKADNPERVFLLSSKAGGTGLNLIGASRIVLYDIDWNPATDLQVMSRIWRSGQKRHCYIYRLLLAGSIEEKIYQRQVMKSGLAGGLETSCWADVDAGAHFTADELRDLFTFRGDTECDTHDLLECECGGSGQLQEDSGAASSSQAHRSCQLGKPQVVERSRSNIEKLMEWRHYTSPIYGKIPDDCLGAAESFVSFLFSDYQDADQN